MKTLLLLSLISIVLSQWSGRVTADTTDEYVPEDYADIPEEDAGGSPQELTGDDEPVGGDKPVIDPEIQLCEDKSIDAAVFADDNVGYAFKGDFYWQMSTSSGISPNFVARYISHRWKGLTGPIDAAFTVYDSQYRLCTVFMKGNQWFLYQMENLKTKGTTDNWPYVIKEPVLSAFELYNSTLQRKDFPVYLIYGDNKFAKYLFPNIANPTHVTNGKTYRKGRFLYFMYDPKDDQPGTVLSEIIEPNAVMSDNNGFIIYGNGEYCITKTDEIPLCKKTSDSETVGRYFGCPRSEFPTTTTTTTTTTTSTTTTTTTTSTTTPQTPLVTTLPPLETSSADKGSRPPLMTEDWRPNTERADTSSEGFHTEWDPRDQTTEPTIGPPFEKTEPIMTPYRPPDDKYEDRGVVTAAGNSPDKSKKDKFKEDEKDSTGLIVLVIVIIVIICAIILSVFLFFFKNRNKSKKDIKGSDKEADISQTESRAQDMEPPNDTKVSLKTPSSSTDLSNRPPSDETVADANKRLATASNVSVRSGLGSGTGSDESLGTAMSRSNSGLTDDNKTVSKSGIHSEGTPNKPSGGAPGKPTDGKQSQEADQMLDAIKSEEDI